MERRRQWRYRSGILGRIVLVLTLLSIGLAGCAGQQLHSAATPPVVAFKNDLTPEECEKLLRVQRDQLRKYGEMEHARAESLQAEKDLNAANAKMQAAINEVKAAHGCPECQISDDLKLMRPAPPVVMTEATNEKNKK